MKAPAFVQINAARSRVDEAMQRQGSMQTPSMASGAQGRDASAALRHARQVLDTARCNREVAGYPLHALGPLANVCDAVAREGQVQPAMAGQCLLGAASLLTQGLFNVQTLAGARPLSLYLLTLGDSGDGKSTAQSAALQPVVDWQRQASKDYRDELRDFVGAKARRKSGDEPPEPPSIPYRLVGDATVEGLRRDLDLGPCAQGVFTDEAAAILAGYGMSAEQRSKSASVYSKLWDSGHLSVSRAQSGRTERYGRRVAMHWLIQPAAASDSVTDPLLRDLGFWPRFLAAWPAPQAPRLAHPFEPHRLPDVGAYWQRCAELLAEPLPDDAGNCPVLELSNVAHKVLCDAFEGFERGARRGELVPIKPFALRAAEQACRVAGVLSAFGGERAVSDATMRGALALVAYSLETWRGLAVEGTVNRRGAAALRLFEWLLSQPNWAQSPTVMLHRGPANLRTKDQRDAALAELESAGLVTLANGLAVVLHSDGGAP